MINILIIDDSPEKTEKLTRHALQVDSQSSISHATNAQDGAKLLFSQRYDLVLLDIILPILPGNEPAQEGGLWLVREIIRKLTAPDIPLIVGVTQHYGRIPEADDLFKSLLWTIINISDATDRWQRQISYAIRYASTRKAPPSSHGKPIDVAVVTALRSPEYDELVDALGGGDSYHIEATGEHWLLARVTTDAGKELNVLAACADEMGTCAMSSLVTRVAFLAKPRKLLLCGIMGGNPKRLSLGDCVLVEETWDYHAGKITNKGFEPDIRSHRANLKLVNSARPLISSTLLHGKWQHWKGEKPKTIPRFFVGAVACSPAVLAKDNAFEEIETQKRKVIGVEMEAFGCYDAASRLGDLAPKVLCIKSVCDVGDSEKDDDFQPFCAYISAHVCVELLKSSKFVDA